MTNNRSDPNNGIKSVYAERQEKKNKESVQNPFTDPDYELAKCAAYMSRRGIRTHTASEAEL